MSATAAVKVLLLPRHVFGEDRAHAWKAREEAVEESGRQNVRLGRGQVEASTRACDGVS